MSELDNTLFLGEDIPAIVFPDEWIKDSPDIYMYYKYLLTTPRPRLGRMKPRRAFLINEDNTECIPHAKRLHKYIQLLIDCRYYRNKTLRESVDIIYDFERKYMDSHSDLLEAKPLSIAGLSKIFTYTEMDLGIVTRVPATGELRESKEKTVRAREIAGDTTDRSKRPRHATTANKKKKVIRGEIAEINKDIEKAKRRQANLVRQAVRRSAKLEIKGDPTTLRLKEGDNENNELVHKDSISTSKNIKSQETDLGKKDTQIIIPTADLITRYTEGLTEGIEERLLMEMYQEIILLPDKKIAFLPTPRQYLFQSADEDIVLYGGAAGGGKSYSMVIDALRYAHIPHYKGVIIRKTTAELGELIDNSRELYPQVFKGAKFNASAGLWRFPSGAQIFFKYLDTVTDKYNFQGHQYQYVGFDELSQHATDEGFRYLHTRCRDPKRKMKPAMRATANPGSLWVYEMFIKDKEPMKTFIMPGTENNERPITMKFIPAMLEDNPHLNNDGGYRAVLESGSEIDREQLLYGNWLIADDNMFPEFKPEIHVVEPYDVPRHWNRTAGLDYGYRDPAAGVWFATNPENGNIVVYDELLQTGMTGREFALAIQKKEEWEDMLVDHPIDWSIYAKTGHTGPSIAESMQSVPNLRLRPADRSREAGWVRVHELFRSDVDTGLPRIEIMSNCKGLIRQLQTAKVHKNKPNDLDDTRNKDGHWDLLDAFRYGVMSRPPMISARDRLQQTKQNDGWGKINSYFS